MKTLPLLIHTVYGDHTLCGKYAPMERTCTREEIDALPTPWETCPLCTLAATCAQLDAARTQRRRTIDTARSRWTQPTLFN